MRGVIVAAALVAACASPAPPRSADVVRPLEVPPIGAVDAGVEPRRPPPGPAAEEEPEACRAPCGGTLADGGAAVATEVKKLRRCYNRALASADPGFAPRVIVEMRVGADGAMCSARLEAPTGVTEFDACVVASLQAARLAAPSGGCVDVRVPVSFVNPP